MAKAYYFLSGENIDFDQNLHYVGVLHPLYLADNYGNQIVDELLADGAAEQPMLLNLWMG